MHPTSPSAHKHAPSKAKNRLVFQKLPGWPHLAYMPLFGSLWPCRYAFQSQLASQPVGWLVGWLLVVRSASKKKKNVPAPHPGKEAEEREEGMTRGYYGRKEKVIYLIHVHVYLCVCVWNVVCMCICCTVVDNILYCYSTYDGYGYCCCYNRWLLCDC